MITVLTIRDPKTGALIAEEQIQPKEDKNIALARIYRKSLGPGAPEIMVISDSIWLEDKKWAADLGEEWGDFGLASLARSESHRGKTRGCSWQESGNRCQPRVWNFRPTNACSMKQRPAADAMRLFQSPLRLHSRWGTRLFSQKRGQIHLEASLSSRTAKLFLCGSPK